MRAAVPFGRYVLLEKLAEGGMAELFLADVTGEAGFARRCVVKRVLPDLAELPDFVTMFLDEARIAARINHPGVVQIFDLGRQPEGYYLAMEYLAGEDAHRVLERYAELGRPMPLALALKIVSDAAEALHHAHELRGANGAPGGIVHRDVSPSNLLLTYHGAVKVLDFGIAVARERLGQTHGGWAKGKALYMSPEQVACRGVDRRADVWALGVVLHELVSGKNPFASGAVAVPLRVLRPEVPAELERAVSKCLERDVDERFATAAELRAVLDEVATTHRLGMTGGQLGSELRALFGEAHASAVIARGQVGGPAQVRSGGTEPLVPAAAAPTTALAQRGRWLGVWAAVVMVAVVLGGAALLWRPREVEVPVVEAPVAVVEEAPAVPEAEEPAAEEEPVEPAAAPAARPHRAVKPARAVEPGTLTLVTQPYARVLLKERELGMTPLFNVSVPGGRQTLRLIGSDNQTRLLTVDVAPKRLTTVRVVLDSLPRGR